MRRLLVVLAAVLAPIIIWLVAVPGFGQELWVGGSGGRERLEIGPPEIIFIGLVAGLAGWVLLAVLERVTRHPRRIWTIVALAVLAASFLPLLDPATAGGTRAVLALMHGAVAAVLVPMLPQDTGRQRTGHRQETDSGSTAR